MHFDRIEIITDKMIRIFKKDIYTIKFFKYFAKRFFLSIKDKIRRHGAMKVNFLLTMTIISSNSISSEIYN